MADVRPIERARRWAGRRLQRLAWAVDPNCAPQGIGWSFTFEAYEGIRFREDRRGCPLWYLSEADYARAHSEADTDHVIVDWSAATYRVGK